MIEMEHLGTSNNSSIFQKMAQNGAVFIIDASSFLTFHSANLLGFVLDTTTRSNKLRSKICTANPTRFVDSAWLDVSLTVIIPEGTIQPISA